MKTFFFGPYSRNDNHKVEAPNLKRAIRSFRVGVLFPHTYSTTRIEQPHPDGTWNKLYVSSAPGGVVPVHELVKGKWVLVAEIPPEAPDEEVFDAKLLIGEADGADVGSAIALPTTSTGMASSSRTELEARHLEIAKQQAALELQKRELQRAMEEMKAELARRTDQVWVIELFLGSKEEVKQIAFGTPAPVDTPITVHQRVLCMDEEMAVFDLFEAPERIGKFSCETLEEFDAWLTEDPRHLAAIFPHPKGVVGLRVRRRTKDRPEYDNSIGSTFVRLALEEYDEMTYLLVVNGGNVYRLWVDVKLWPRLFASEKDVTLLDSDELRNRYERAKQQQQNMKMQMAGLIALTGLLQRSNVLSPLPKPDINALNPRDVDAYFNLVRDDEDRLLLGDGRDFEGLTWGGYSKWLRAQVTTGVRVWWTGKPSYEKNALEERTGLRTIDSWPSAREVYTIEYAKTVNFGTRVNFKYLPSGERWDPYDDTYTARKRRVTFMTYSDEVIPVDYLSWRVLEHLIRDRGQRGYYGNFFKLSADFYLLAKATAEAEKPFIDLVLTSAGVALDNEVERARCERLTRWWKMKVKEHRTLGTDEAKAYRMILKAFKAGEDEVNDPEYLFMREFNRK